MSVSFLNVIWANVIALLARLGMGYSILMGVVLVLWWLTGEQLAPINLFVNLMPALFFPAIFLLIILSLGREWRVVTLLVPIVGTFLWLYGVAMLPRSDQVAATTEDLTVLTYNMWVHNDNLEDVIRLIETTDADIVALQEVQTEFVRYANTRLRDQYPFQVAREDPKRLQYDGRMILSRYPITNYQIQTGVGRDLLYLRAEIDFNGQPLAIYSVHLCPVTMHGGFSTALRHADLSLLLEHAAQETMPTVFLGDFNMTDTTADYHLATAQYSDAFRESTSGLGTTYPDWGTFITGLDVIAGAIRIDYVFADENFDALDAAVLAGGGSDHRPVWAQLRLRR